MNIIFLSGGSGKRLWPLSNEVNSKQFLSILKNPDGEAESMVQRMYRSLKKVVDYSSVTFATSKSQVSSLRRQLGENVSISIEPIRRNTFPAIVLAAAYLHDIKSINIEEPIIVCPIDSFVDIDYFFMLQSMAKQVESNKSNLVLMGITPTFPSENYGYIIPASSDNISTVSSFKEKPQQEEAEKYIRKGALWNGGVFAFKLNYILRIAERLLGYSNYDLILKNYSLLPADSFDHVIVEKEKNVQVMRFSGLWKDIGNWKSLTETMEDYSLGNAKVIDCNNTHVINELQIPVVTLGTKNLTIAASYDGILVTDKNHCNKVKNLVPLMRPMREEREWGEYYVIDYQNIKDGKESLTKHLVIGAGKHISYQCHNQRVEMWMITEGTGEMIINGETSIIKCGSTITIPAGTKHAVRARETLHIIEVQIGYHISEDDIDRFEWKWE